MLLPWRRRIVAIVTASVATLPLHVVIIVAAAIPLPLALITADTLPGVEGGARGVQHGRQTHFTCVEKINAKRLKKQLPHKLRSVSVRRTTTNRRIHGRAMGGVAHKTCYQRTCQQANKQTRGEGRQRGCTYEHILAIRHLANKCAKHAKTCKMHCEIETAQDSPPAPSSLLLS